MAKILLVDDEPNIVSLTKLILEKEGFQVVIAKNGVECMGMLKEDRPDLILLDVMMPGEDGWEVCRKIKKDERTKDIPVVMFTIRTCEDSKSKSFYYSKAEDHIDKPFSKKDLLDTIERILKKTNDY